MNQVVVVQADEKEYQYLSQPATFAEQVSAFAAANLYTQIARNAYPSELSMEAVVEKVNDFLGIMLEDFRQEIIAYINPTAPDVETLLSKAQINAVLYESPSESGKIAYWQITYQWDYGDEDGIYPEGWPIYYIVISCDTSSGNPFLIDYYYYPFLYFSEDCGLEACAEVLGVSGELNIMGPTEFDGTSAEGSISVGEWKHNFYYQLMDQEFCILKSMFFEGEGRDRIQLIPNSMIEQE